MTIASEITRIKTNIENAYTKAEEKGATMPELLNSEGLAGCIESIPKGSGGGSGIDIPEGYSRIRFYDIDGTILSEQIVEDLGDITNIPEPPEHEYLKFNSWNWYTDFNTTTPYAVGHMNIGAIYDTIDENIYVGIELNEDTGLSVSYNMSLYMETYTTKPEAGSTYTYTVDFGDGSVETYSFTVDSSTSSYHDIPSINHVYENYGSYVIKINDAGNFSEEETDKNYYNRRVLFGGIRSKKTYEEIKFLYMNRIMSQTIDYLTYFLPNLEKVSITVNYNGSDRRTIHSLSSWTCFGSNKLRHINFPRFYIRVVFGPISLQSVESISFDCGSDSVAGYNNMFDSTYTIEIKGAINYSKMKDIVLPLSTYDNSIANISYNDFIIYNLDKNGILTNNKKNVTISRTVNRPFIKNLSSINYKLNQNFFVSHSAEINCSPNSDELHVHVNAGQNNSSGGNIFTRDVSKIIFEKNNTSYTYTYPWIHGYGGLKELEFKDVNTYSGTAKINFAYCYRLEDVDIESMYPNATQISIDGDSSNGYGFQNCYNLKSINFPENIPIYLGDRPFEYCYKLENINLSNSLCSSYLNNYSFRGCKSLKEIDLSSITSSNSNSEIGIGQYCFSECYGLKKVKLPLHKHYFNSSYVFYQCYNLEEVDFSNATRIMSSANNMFYSCYKLKKIWFPSTIDLSGWTSSSGIFNNIHYDIKVEENKIIPIIYTDATEMPTNWGSSFNKYEGSKTLPVYWGATKENYENGDPIPA